MGTSKRSFNHAIKFTPDDWQVVVELAKELDITPAMFVNMAAGAASRRFGRQWQGLLPRGRQRRD